MAFPLSIEGSFRIAAAEAREDITPLVLKRAEAFLASESSNITVNGNVVRSNPDHMSWLFGGRGQLHPIALVDDLTLEISSDKHVTTVVYRLSLRRAFYAVTAIAISIAVVGTLGSIGSGHMMTSAFKLSTFALLAILWLFGANFVLTALRAPSWLRKKFAGGLPASASISD